MNYGTSHIGFGDSGLVLNVPLSEREIEQRNADRVNGILGMSNDALEAGHVEEAQALLEEARGIAKQMPGDSPAHKALDDHQAIIQSAVTEVERRGIAERGKQAEFVALASDIEALTGKERPEELAALMARLVQNQLALAEKLNAK